MLPQDFEIIKQAIESLGVTVERKFPSNLEGATFIVFGASQNSLILRLKFLNNQLNKKQGEIGTLYLLGGDRKLWPQYSGQDEGVKKSLSEIKFSYEDSTALLLENLNKDKSDKELKSSAEFQIKINTLIEEYIKNKSPNITEIRKRICQYFESAGYIYPTESDLERHLAKIILKIDDSKIKIIEGEIEEIINRPTTETTLKKLADELTQDSDLRERLLIFISNAPHMIKQEAEIKKALQGQGLKFSISGPSCDVTPDLAHMIESVLGTINTRSQQIATATRQQPSTPQSLTGIKPPIPLQTPPNRGDQK